MYQFEKIKLIIWDLDETFWKGTLSEERVIVPEENRKLLSLLTDIGIVNSICSKNDWGKVENELKQQRLLEYFVFPSVNWQPKGARVKQMISNMQLRPANVLFIDDNPSNRGEVEHFCSEIMVEGPECISQLLEDAYRAEKKDTEHKRLKQYQILAEKHLERANYSSNEAFLRESNIRVEISKECFNHIDRIHDLLLRSNQLNFTKLRSSKQELQKLLEAKDVESGYVSVSDRFGEYGIVGFYSICKGKLIHFVFSCRTLGMGIEQYMYNILGRPELQIVGEVISELDSTITPDWINQNVETDKSEKMQIHNLKEHLVLVKGPCDLFQIYPYIANSELFDTEFTYTNDNGLVIESTGHTTHIVESLRLSQKQKNTVLSEVPFSDIGMYNDNIFKKGYKVVVLSILADCNLGVYRRKETGERLAILEYIHPITDSGNWAGLVSKKYPTANFCFTEEILKNFADKYEYIGRNTPEQIIENLVYIREHLPDDCMMVVMLGGELYYEKNTYSAYEDRHLVHQCVNQKIRQWASEKNNIYLMDVNKYLVDQNSFYDHFNHYIKPVYYALAGELVGLVNDWTGSEVRETSKAKMHLVELKEMLAPIYYKIKAIFRR